VIVITNTRSNRLIYEILQDTDRSIRRLPIYLRALSIAAQQGRKKVSSQELAEILSVKSSQSGRIFHFSAISANAASATASRSLTGKSERFSSSVLRKAALVGCGNLGSAVLSYPGFKLYGFDIAAAFDCDKKKIGKKVKRITVDDVSNLSVLKKIKLISVL